VFGVGELMCGAGDGYEFAFFFFLSFSLSYGVNT